MTQYLKSYPVEPHKEKNKLLLKMTPVCLMLVLGSDDRLLYIYLVHFDGHLLPGYVIVRFHLASLIRVVYQ